jgi:hypothetical protein
MADIPITAKNAFTATLPPLSISTIVLKASEERPLAPVSLRVALSSCAAESSCCHLTYHHRHWIDFTAPRPF